MLGIGVTTAPSDVGKRQVYFNVGLRDLLAESLAKQSSGDELLFGRGEAQEKTARVRYLYTDE